MSTYAYLASGNGLNQIQSVSYDYLGTNPYTNTESFIYDEFNRLQSTTENINGSPFTHAFTYNDNNQLLTETYPSGLTATHNYDTKGFLENITSNNSIVYEPLATNNYGQLTSYKLGNGLTSTMQYDDFGFLTNSYTDDNSVFNMSYDFNAMNGNLNWRKDATIGGPNGLKETFSYDASFDRLINAAHGTTSTDFTYEDNGNILTKTDVSANPYIYDATKMYQVTNINEAIAATGPPETIEYNAAQQPITIYEEINNANKPNLNILYGADQQRRFAQLAGSGDADYQRYYVGDFERNIKNGVTQDIHSVAPGVIIVEENNVYSEYYTYSDHLGSINVVTDESGTVVARQSFDAWGRKRNATDWTYDNVEDYELSWLHRGYTGHEMLPEFGLINMNGRLYDNYLGRMLSPDEYAGYDGTSQSYNRYSYAFNNPLKFTDPTGEIFIPGLTFKQSLDLVMNVALQHAANQSGNVLTVIIGKKVVQQQVAKNIAQFSTPAFTGLQKFFQLRNNPDIAPSDRLITSVIYSVADNTNHLVRLPFTGRGESIRSLDGLNNVVVGSDESTGKGLMGIAELIPVGNVFKFLKAGKGTNSAVNVVDDSVLNGQRNIVAKKGTNQVDEVVYGYHGVDNTGVKYVGISNNPTTRFGAHGNALDTGREFLNYNVKASFKSRIEARIWEQKQINQFGLNKNGGGLLNKRNEIAEKYWSNYGIKK